MLDQDLDVNLYDHYIQITSGSESDERAVSKGCKFAQQAVSIN